MRHILLGGILLAASLPSLAATVEVRIANVTAGKGKLNLAVCDRERYLKQCPFSTSVPAKGGEMVVVFRDVPAGTWAVIVYQDENENNQLDRNFIGVPKENYGFSRDAVNPFGPPSFDQAAIEVREGTTVAPIKLH